MGSSNSFISSRWCSIICNSSCNLWWWTTTSCLIPLPTSIMWFPNSKPSIWKMIRWGEETEVLISLIITLLHKLQRLISDHRTLNTPLITRCPKKEVNLPQQEATTTGCQLTSKIWTLSWVPAQHKLTTRTVIMDLSRAIFLTRGEQAIHLSLTRPHPVAVELTWDIKILISLRDIR